MFDDDWISIEDTRMINHGGLGHSSGVDDRARRVAAESEARRTAGRAGSVSGESRAHLSRFVTSPGDLGSELAEPLPTRADSEAGRAAAWPRARRRARAGGAPPPRPQLANSNCHRLRSRRRSPHCARHYAPGPSGPDAVSNLNGRLPLRWLTRLRRSH